MMWFYRNLNEFLAKGDIEGALEYLEYVIKRFGSNSLQGCFYDSKTLQEQTLLGLCSRWGSLPLCKKLLEYGADPLYPHLLQEGTPYASCSTLKEVASSVETDMQRYQNHEKERGKNKDTPLYSEYQLDLNRIAILRVLLEYAQRDQRIAAKSKSSSKSAEKEKVGRATDFDYAYGVWEVFLSYWQRSLDHRIESTFLPHNLTAIPENEEEEETRLSEDPPMGLGDKEERKQEVLSLLIEQHASPSLPTPPKAAVGWWETLWNCVSHFPFSPTNSESSSDSYSPGAKLD